MGFSLCVALAGPDSKLVQVSTAQPKTYTFETVFAVCIATLTCNSGDSRWRRAVYSCENLVTTGIRNDADDR